MTQKIIGGVSPPPGSLARQADALRTIGNDLLRQAEKLNAMAAEAAQAPEPQAAEVAINRPPCPLCRSHCCDKLWNGSFICRRCRIWFDVERNT